MDGRDGDALGSGETAACGERAAKNGRDGDAGGGHGWSRLE